VHEVASRLISLGSTVAPFALTRPASAALEVVVVDSAVAVAVGPRTDPKLEQLLMINRWRLWRWPRWWWIWW